MTWTHFLSETSVTDATQYLTVLLEVAYHCGNEDNLQDLICFSLV